MDTPKCVATYEAGHSYCDGDASGGACRLRKPCIELRRFALAEKFEPGRLASSLSLKEIKAFYAGRLELRVISAGPGGKRLHKITQQKRVKTTPIFGKKHWRLYYEFERAMCEYFQRFRVANRLAPERRFTKARIPTYRRKAAIRTGALYPVARARGNDIEWVVWECVGYRRAYRTEPPLIKIKPLNKPSRLWIRMQFPIAELELRAAPELISELGLNIRSGAGIYFILRTASVRLIRLSVYALKIMIDSGYMGVPGFGALNAEGGGGD